MMINFMIIFFPTFISIYILNKRTKKDLKELILAYPVYNLIINVMTMLIVCIYKKGSVNVIENFNIMNFCLKYLLLATVFAIIVPYIKEFVCKNISGKIEIRRDKKKDEKKC